MKAFQHQYIGQSSPQNEIELNKIDKVDVKQARYSFTKLENKDLQVNQIIKLMQINENEASF